LGSAPGVLAVKVDYSTGKATIGLEAGQPVPEKEIRAALKSINYQVEFVEPVGQ
jgi:DNA-dependent RNA polymerase auxiliary subunit epsilon